MGLVGEADVTTALANGVGIVKKVGVSIEVKGVRVGDEFIDWGGAGVSEAADRPGGFDVTSAGAGNEIAVAETGYNVNSTCVSLSALSAIPSPEGGLRESAGKAMNIASSNVGSVEEGRSIVQ